MFELQNDGIWHIQCISYPNEICFGGKLENTVFLCVGNLTFY